MNLQQFQQESRRTMPFGGSPQNHIEYSYLIDNYAKGLVGEWFEFVVAEHKNDRDAEIKEAGDVLHYAVGILTALEETYDAEKLEPIEINKITTAEALGDVLEITKKYFHHQHELDKARMIEATYTVIKMFVAEQGLALPVILQTNIDKLKTRYPEKFTPAASQARVDV